MKIQVFFHDRCFDGGASAALFTRFYQGCFHPDAEFSYTGLIHRASQLFDEKLFSGDENVIVDFKYCASPRLDWWFDHHQSAFLTPEDAAHFRQDQSGKKYYDPAFKSCTKLIASVGSQKFGFQAPDLEDLVNWADIVDGALFPDAWTAVSMEAPALKLAMIMEGGPDEDMARWLIPQLARQPLSEIGADEKIARLFEPLFEQHKRSMESIRELGRCENGVVFFDLTGPGIEAYNKFVPYFLFPDCVYSVSVCPSSLRTKISVGSNPWNKSPLLHNLATICERYGGGGHPRVGAISLEPDSVEKARRIAREIVEDLQKPVGQGATSSKP
ncbi:MAG: phosphoesterase [Acidobacteria bacterium]|nr:phosphoesterase [Acidobacteriota bacterium]